VSASARKPRAIPQGETAGGHHGSVWPLVAAIGVFLLASGLVATLSLGGLGIGWLLLALAVTVVGSVGWWRQLIQEPATAVGPADGYKDRRVGFILFIASEVAFFAAFFIGYFFLRGTAPVWPPEGTPPMGPLRLPMLNTIALGISGLTLTMAHSALRRNQQRAFLAGLTITVLLGIAFLAGQAMEWRESALTLSSGPLGNAFYLLTGFHGLHVLVGVVFLTVVLVRGARGAFTPHRHDALTMAGWYWHFVDVVWLLLFVSFYLL
jgi:cytochrome c oxidase subunit 3